MKILKSLVTVFKIFTIAAILSSLTYGAYYLGYINGNNTATKAANKAIADILTNNQTTVSSLISDLNEKPDPVTVYVEREPRRKAITWGGPDLWEAVNKRRKELGVNPISQVDELCTIASIRLNEQLLLGRIDNHEGFSNMAERRPEFLPTFEKYNISEFLLSGAQTAEEAVGLWENTLAHKKLLTGGEYVWGCIYAQDSFAVAITAF